MTSLTRRTSFAAFAAMLAAPILARAQNATTAPPAGGVGSTTAPSNSEGTPAGGTGVIGTSRTGGGAGSPMVGGEMNTSETPRRRRRRHRRARRTTTPQ